MFCILLFLLRLGLLRRVVRHLRMFQVHLLQLGEHLIGVAVVSCRDLVCELVELGIVRRLLKSSPFRTLSQGLKSPVTEEDVAREDLEGVTGHVHLVDLRVPRHSEAHEALVEEGRRRSGHVQRLVSVIIEEGM